MECPVSPGFVICPDGGHRRLALAERWECVDEGAQEGGDRLWRAL